LDFVAYFLLSAYLNPTCVEGDFEVLAAQPCPFLQIHDPCVRELDRMAALCSERFSLADTTGSSSMYLVDQEMSKHRALCSRSDLWQLESAWWTPWKQ